MRVRENRKLEPGKSEDSDKSAESDSNANFSSAFRSTKVGPPRGVPKGHSSSANSESSFPDACLGSTNRFLGSKAQAGILAGSGKAASAYSETQNLKAAVSMTSRSKRRSSLKTSVPKQSRQAFTPSKSPPPGE